MKNIVTRVTPLSIDIASLLLRLLFGGLFIYSGWMKIDNYTTYQPMMEDYIGLGSKLSYNLVIFAEFGCGIFVLLGFLTRLTVLPIIFAMCIAYFMAHAKDAFMMKQLPFVFIWLGVIIFLLGSGKYSIDAILFHKKQSRV